MSKQLYKVCTTNYGHVLAAVAHARKTASPCTSGMCSKMLALAATATAALFYHRAHGGFSGAHTL
eukprot:scaffold7390_cov100-Isochrysis_galbana.AAC.2